MNFVIMIDLFDYVKICESCFVGDGWGLFVISEIIFDGVFYVFFLKGDKFGCMVDWIGSKDGECGGCI